ncbi:uncharacterized protein LOC119788091 isoform X2 [Cyprinodon tularosa]|uniref:uncharacterized protein LOC119788091 isoform X2 n=1 Tax=Cyprinodon tularosa TaxID=77115 RepID=UPI0018E2317D|nr:uncharacterized protein LOC119788091 isoform X2 [Cyprinodon tularosa]
MAFQQNDNKMNTEEHCMDTSTSEGEDEELSTESMTTCILDVHIPENEEAVSYSEDNLTDTSSNQGENHADDEDMMEGNNAGEKTPKLKVGSEDQADGDNPLYPGASISKGESILMLMSYVLRHNLTGKAVTHLLEMFNLMFPGLIPPSPSYLFHKEFKGSSQSEIHFYCEKCLAYLGNSAHCNSQCTHCNKAFDANRRSFLRNFNFNKRKTESCKVLTESVRDFGNPTMQKSIKISYRLAIAKLCGNLSNCFWSFNRFLVSGVLYHSQKYDKLKKRYNSAVYLKDGTLCLINDLVIFKQKCSHEISALCSCTKMCCVLVEVLAKLDRPVCKDSQINIQSTFLFEVKKTETVNAVWPDMLLTKCVLVERDNALYITPLPNACERLELDQ